MSSISWHTKDLNKASNHINLGMIKSGEKVFLIHEGKMTDIWFTDFTWPTFKCEIERLFEAEAKTERGRE